MEISETALLMGCPLFSGVPAEDLPELLSALDARRQDFRRGSWLLRQGDTPVRLGILLSGRAHILREDFWGNRDIIAPLSPGELFGEAYACAGVPAGVDVQAEEDGAVLFLEVSRLSGVPGGADLLENLLSATARKNLLLNEKLSHVTRRTTRDKLLSYLSREAARQGSTFTIPFDRQQLADYLAVDRSAMSAELGKLRREGLLDFRKNRFTLLRRPEEHR
ncbi:Crp/Fnr family transcriptional regulator [Dysosmobacter sp. HCP28S3_G4]|uniref:Crp/Fnr family transcriptional regulator n=1 Tax=Dysosmobacter sp. HCP28S3_G4 TaxID=3438938 RepID=UPI003F89A9DE